MNMNKGQATRNPSDGLNILLETDRPLVSFILFAYNQEQFIREAVEGAFAQTYSPLEIILSDDCSTDRTFEVICEMSAAYQGPHTIATNRTSRNAGLSSHINQVVAIASGKLLVFAAGDDVSLPQRTSKLVTRWQDINFMECCIHSDAHDIDPDGNFTGNISKPNRPDRLFNLRQSILWCAYMLGATEASSKSLWDKYPQLDPKIKNEDIILSFRGASNGGCHYLPEPLIHYRRDLPSQVARGIGMTPASYWAGIETQLNLDYGTVGELPTDLRKAVLATSCLFRAYDASLCNNYVQAVALTAKALCYGSPIPLVMNCLSRIHRRLGKRIVTPILTLTNWYLDRKQLP